MLSNSRNEPTGPQTAAVQEGWNAGRSAPQAPVTGSKRTAQQARLVNDDDDFGWDISGAEERAVAIAADTTSAPQTPHKALKAGVYATPVTQRTRPRRLPWLDDTPSNAASTTVTTAPPSNALASIKSPTTDPVTPTPATRFHPPHTPSTPATLLDELHSAISAFSASAIPSALLTRLREIATRHDLRARGVTQGREAARVALQGKEAVIAKLKGRVGELEAEAELLRDLVKGMRRREGRGGEGGRVKVKREMEWDGEESESGTVC